ncbi:hypothetical protein DPMN_010705 [Dreissena polymorpha]|uniref:Uncharacterized protein n=1 Tax=Dreissena polymorpha TaxID=45954 RepID=A0A9D4N4P8_DREPO|nr:hypothetical protein DPMN_010705 [Dreissena polymorpha]
MKVSWGRPVKVNNFLTTLNITLIAYRNLKKMEARAGETIKKISTVAELRHLTRLPLMLMRKKWSKCKT